MPNPEYASKVIISSEESGQDDKPIDTVKLTAELLEKLENFVKVKAPISEEEVDKFKSSLTEQQRVFLEQNLGKQGLIEYVFWLKNGLFDEKNSQFREEIMKDLDKVVKYGGQGANFFGAHHLEKYMRLHQELIGINK